MSESLISVAGKNVHTNQRTISATAYEDEFTIPGEYPYASYIASATGITAANAGDDIFQLMAGAALNLRIRRIRLEQSAAITTAALSAFQVARLTSAGTGGGAVTPSKMDGADGGSGATAASAVPTATKGTIGAVFFTRSILPVQTVGAGGGPSPVPYWEWVAQPGMKPILIPAGATNGLCIRNQGARAGLTVAVEIEFVETNFV